MVKEERREEKKRVENESNKETTSLVRRTLASVSCSADSQTQLWTTEGCIVAGRACGPMPIPKLACGPHCTRWLPGLLRPSPPDKLSCLMLSSFERTNLYP